MLIVLDTNLLISDPAATSGPMAILLDYAHRTESRVMLSALVQEELLANKVRQLESQWDAYVRSSGLIRAFVPSAPVIPTKPDVEAVARAQLAGLRKRLHISDRDILPTTETQLREAVGRAIRRVPPCTDRGEEVRDCILWLQILELVRQNQSDTVAFISANTKQFASKDGTLLPGLAEEVSRGRLVYYASLDSFAKQHATAIKFITREWLEERISAEEVFQRAEVRLESLARRAAGSAGGYAPSNIEGYWIDLDDFYVYEMEDGTLRVQAYWYGTLEVPGDEPDDYGYDFNPVTGKNEYHYSSLGGDYKSKEVEVIITVEAIAQSQHMQGWDVIDVERA